MRLLFLSTGLLLTLSAAMSHGASHYADAVLADGPVAYYRFSDGVTTPSFDTLTNRGSLGTAANGIYNGAVHPVAGALASSSDTAARFSGGQNGSIAYNAGLNNGGAFTVEAWLRPAATFTDGTLTCPLSSVQINSPRSGWLIYQGSTGWNFRTYNTNTTATAVNITSGGTLSTGVWYHVVAVWDGTVARVYTNGALAATSPATNYVANTNTPFTIGMRSDAAFVWAGDADEVAYYPSVLTAGQIAAHYQNGLNGALPVNYEAIVLADSPAGYWRLGEPAYAPPTAVNSGSLAAAANGTYQGGAFDGVQAPRPPQFFGFESDNTALQLDGVNDFVKTVNGLLNGKPRFTLSGWIRRNGAQADRTGLFGQNDIVEFGYINNSTLEIWTDNGLDIGNAFPDTAWSHIALVHDGSPGTVTMYTNGIAAGSRTSTLPGDNTFPFNIGGGGIFDGSGNFFNGQMDEIAVFDKALTADQIQGHYFSTVPSLPIITQQPQGTNIFEGGNAILSVKAIGSPTLVYQWVNFGDPIPNATNATFVITNVTEMDSSSYWVIVTNQFGTVESSPADVTVMPTAKPTITQEPISVTRYAGAGATLTVAGTGGSRLEYQWLRNATLVTGATNSVLVLSNLQANAQYQAVVINAAGSTTSTVATVTVIALPPGSYAEMIVGTAPLAYWRFNESSGTTAFDFVGGNDATYSNTAITGIEAPLPPSYHGFEADNRAVQLDGTNGYVRGPVGLMNGATNFSMIGWVRRATNQADRTGLFGQNDLIEFGFINNNTLQIWTDNGLDVANSFPNGEWDMISVVAEGSPGTLTIYTNGAAAGSRTHMLPNDSSFSFNIGGGGIFDGSGNFFNGQIDEVSVYKKALSSDTICELYTRATGKPVQMKSSASGNLIVDSKPLGTGYDGANFGPTWSASNSDTSSTTRDGVMQFVAGEGDQITLAPNSDFNSAQGAITFWMRSAGTTGDGNSGAMLVDRRSNRGDVIVQNDDGTIFVQANDGNGTVNSFSSSATVNDGRWHHVAYVYNQAGSTTVYIDGVAAGTQTTSRSWAWDPAQQIELGRSHDGYWRQYNGLLDDFRIYNRALTAAEVAQIADAGALVDPTALKVRFNFDAAPSGVTMSWLCGTLQYTDNLVANGAGTVWTDLPNARTPYIVNPQRAPNRFYRVKY